MGLITVEINNQHPETYPSLLKKRKEKEKWHFAIIYFFHTSL